MKAAIYLRTSTLEQKPVMQKKPCIKFAESRGYTIEGIYLEQISAYKQKDRPQYEKVKNKAFKGEIQAVIVWALDRWVRNRDTLLEDVTILRNFNCKLHSVNEQWLEAINIEGALGKTIQEFLLGLVGSLAELESQRKSERVKMAYKNHKGKSWGRPNIKDRVKADIIEMYNRGYTMRKIAAEITYWTRNKNKKPVSLSFVHKTIKEFKGKKSGIRKV